MRISASGPVFAAAQFHRGLIILLLFSGVSGCDWFGPSDFFRGLDTDDNGSVDVEEWMSYYGPHDHAWESCSGNDFEPADCNGDLELSWSEYHSARFESDFCGDSQAHLTIYQKPDLDLTTGRHVILPPACRIDLTSLTQQPQVAIAGSRSALSICEAYGASIKE